MEFLRKRTILGAVTAVILLLTFTIWHVSAQTNALAWNDPVNISQSDGAIDPSFVVDDTNVYHIFWQDIFEGMTYTRGNGTNWEVAQTVRIPFSAPAYGLPSDNPDDDVTYYPPTLVPQTGLIHAFWQDVDGGLIYSRALSTNMTGGSASWTAPVPLARPIGALAAVVDGTQRLHLTYIRSDNDPGRPAGVYHQFSDDQGQSWSTPTLLYGSSYYRDISEVGTQISLATVGQNRLYVAWDNRRLDAVFTAVSTDGGATWSDPTLIDQRSPEDVDANEGPANIHIQPLDESNIHLSWHRGRPDVANACRVMHRWSADGGATWSDAAIVLEDTLACPTQTDFLVSQNNLLVLMSLVRGNGFLQAWNGEQWSRPEPQTVLADFRDPQTFRTVELGCQQTYVDTANQLFVVGCGTGSAQDIWTIKRPLGTLEDWFGLFAATPVWQAPVSLISSSVSLLPGDMVAGADGRIHAFWSQSSDIVEIRRLEEVTTEVGPDIYYSRYTDGQWGAPRPIITAPDGNAAQIATAADTNGGLYVAWSSGKEAGLFITRASAERASSVTEWIAPVLIPAPRTTGSWPDILITENRLLLAYTIPLNEDRGIYLVESADRGETWSEPVQIFDGEAAGWQVVGRPRLARTQNGQLHIMWTRDLPTSNSTLALVYATSADEGVTWSEPEAVTEDTVIWSDLVGVGTRTVHRAWQAISDNRVLLWHQVSFDNGISWSTPERVSDPAMDSGAASLVLGVNDTPYLLQLGQNSNADLLLLEWAWDGARWEPGNPLQLGATSLGADALHAAFLPSGELGVIYGALVIDPATGDIEDNLLFTSRELDPLAIEATPLPTLTPTPQPTSTAVPTSTPTPEPTVQLPPVINDDGNSVGPINTSSQSGGILIGVLPALLIVGIFFAAGFWLIRRN